MRKFIQKASRLALSVAVGASLLVSSGLIAKADTISITYTTTVVVPTGANYRVGTVIEYNGNYYMATHDWAWYAGSDTPNANWICLSQAEQSGVMQLYVAAPV